MRVPLVPSCGVPHQLHSFVRLIARLVYLVLLFRFQLDRAVQLVPSTKRRFPYRVPARVLVCLQIGVSF